LGWVLPYYFDRIKKGIKKNGRNQLKKEGRLGKAKVRPKERLDWLRLLPNFH